MYPSVLIVFHYNFHCFKRFCRLEYLHTLLWIKSVPREGLELCSTDCFSETKSLSHSACCWGVGTMMCFFLSDVPTLGTWVLSRWRRQQPQVSLACLSWRGTPTLWVRAKVIRTPEFSLALCLGRIFCLMSGSSVEKWDLHLSATLTKNLATSSWGQDEKCCFTPRGSTTLLLGSVKREGDLYFWLNQSGVEFSSHKDGMRMESMVLGSDTTVSHNSYWVLVYSLE